MTEKTDHLINRLTETGDAILDYFRGLAAEQWETVVYSDENQWTVRTLFSHIVSSEASMTRLYQRIAEGGEGSPEDFDIDRFNKSRVEKMADTLPEELLTQFESAQQELLEWIATLDDEALAIEGRHPTVGVLPLGDLIKVIYKHNHIHLDEVREALGN